MPNELPGQRPRPQPLRLDRIKKLTHDRTVER
jgi:hypothetical protein